MLDNINLTTLDDLPEELIVTILANSGPETLARVGAVNRKYNRLANIAELWKTHLNDFKSILKSKDNAVSKDAKNEFSELYLKNFIRLSLQQAMEIEYFLSIKQSFFARNLDAQNEKLAADAYALLDKYLDKLKAKTFKDLVARSKELDAAIENLNCVLINPVIELAKTSGKLELNLNELGITRIPESLLEKNKAFWGNIQHLNANNNNLIMLPENINVCKNLRELQVSKNKLESLPQAIAQLPSLNTLLVNFNFLKELPKLLGKEQNLSRIFAGYNYLNALPATLAEPRDLSLVDLSFNRFQKIPEILLAKPLRAFGINGNLLKSIPAESSLPFFDFTEIRKINHKEVLHSQQSQKSEESNKKDKAKKVGKGMF